MRTTSYLNLSVPELTDKPDITPISENFEKIDSAIGDVGGFYEIKSLPEQFKSNSLYFQVTTDFSKGGN